MARPYKILHCEVTKLEELLYSPEVCGLRVLAILPTAYVNQPTLEQIQQLTWPVAWPETLKQVAPSIFLTRVTIILES